jgi:hypothetical protein
MVGLGIDLPRCFSVRLLSPPFFVSLTPFPFRQIRPGRTRHPICPPRVRFIDLPSSIRVECRYFCPVRFVHGHT